MWLEKNLGEPRNHDYDIYKNVINVKEKKRKDNFSSQRQLRVIEDTFWIQQVNYGGEDENLSIGFIYIIDNVPECCLVYFQATLKYFSFFQLTVLKTQLKILESRLPK